MSSRAGGCGSTTVKSVLLAREDRSQGGRGIAALEMDIGEEAPLRISASFGLTLLAPDLPVGTSIDRADKALYAAKAAGRNCVRVWDPAI